MNQMVARFLVSNTLFIINVAILLVLAIHLLGSWLDRGWTRTYDRLGNKVAIAFLGYVSGETVLRAWSGLWLWMMIHGQRDEAMQILDRYYIALGSLAVTTLFAICIMRVISRERYGDWLWLSCSVAAIIINIGLHYFAFPM